jgi:hypothetical protein
LLLPDRDPLAEYLLPFLPRHGGPVVARLQGAISRADGTEAPAIPQEGFHWSPSRIGVRVRDPLDPGFRSLMSIGVSYPTYGAIHESDVLFRHVFLIPTDSAFADFSRIRF